MALLRDQFVVDVYQAGAGTSHHMNVNEVLANRAAEVLGGAKGDIPARAPERPRQHGPVDERRVPDGDAARAAARAPRRSSTRRARSPRRSRARPTRSTAILKVGRTHLQDAVPMTLGQEFSGYAACIARGADDVERAAEQLEGAEPRRDRRRHRPQRRRGLHERWRSSTWPRYTGLPLRPAGQPASASRRAWATCVAYSGAMRRLAVELGKVASDLRLLSMGPRAGIAEIALPAVQPGSSIMPGQGQSVDSRDGEPGVLPGDRAAT